MKRKCTKRMTQEDITVVSFAAHQIPDNGEMCSKMIKAEITDNGTDTERDRRRDGPRRKRIDKIGIIRQKESGSCIFNLNYQLTTFKLVYLSLKL